jgi:hypothetical protein
VGEQFEYKGDDEASIEQLATAGDNGGNVGRGQRAAEGTGNSKNRDGMGQDGSDGVGSQQGEGAGERVRTVEAGAQRREQRRV